MHCKLGKKLYLLESRGEGHRRDCSLGQPWKLEEGGGEREREWLQEALHTGRALVMHLCIAV